jgi:predicted PurR-regulated permease PerM
LTVLDGRKLAEDTVLLFKRGQRGIITVVLAELSQMLGHFVRAQVILSALSVGVITVFLVVMRMPYAYALGPIAPLRLRQWQRKYRVYQGDRAHRFSAE